MPRCWGSSTWDPKILSDPFEPCRRATLEQPCGARSDVGLRLQRRVLFPIDRGTRLEFRTDGNEVSDRAEDAEEDLHDDPHDLVLVGIGPCRVGDQGSVDDPDDRHDHEQKYKDQEEC